MNTQSRGGWKLTDETRHKISIALKNRPLTIEHRRAISDSRRGAVPPHGDRNRYKRLGCRCESCRRAQSEYRAVRKA